MSALSLSRTESPQAFVSSFAPRVRTYQNSLLTPAIQPPNAIAALRTTKRGTTAINYSEDVENDSLVEDSDGPRRPTGLRSLRVNDSHTAVSTGGAGERGIQSMELTSPVDVQGIWREWMGKPKKAMTERQTMTQAQLPLNLVPIRIDLGVNPFQPEAPLPKPNNARELGVDESSPAYKAPDLTPELRIKDAFLWNLHESLMTPDQFAKVFVDELDFPVERRPALALQVSQQIRTQLEEHAAVVMHPLFNPSTTNTSTSNNNNNINNNTTADTRAAPTRAPLSRDMSSTPFAHTPSNALATSTPDANVSAIAHPLPPSSPHNPDDAHRCIISLSVNLMNRLYTDKFEWSLMHPAGFPEIFAKQTCADLALSGEWVPALAHAIYEAVLKLKKDYCENNGSLLAVIGSGMDAWGQIDNESAEVHGDGTLALAEGAGWRFDNEDLGAEWQPRVEVLSKEEIEKREGDRERQIRRLRRETAARATAAGMASMPSDYFGVQAGTGEEERMGRGERSKKKRRFRSLSPTGRETPDFTAAFGGEQGKLTESERPMWQCTHCRIAGNAVWAVRDGPSGPRSLCNNCGLLYERDKRLPPWSKDLYLIEQPKPSRSEPPQHMSHLQSHPTPHTPSSTSSFIPNISRALHRNNSSSSNNNHHHQTSHLQQLLQRRSGDTNHHPQHHHSSSDMVQQDIYAATVRGGGPSMFEDYAVEGEDLDWTKVTDARERKRLQNIINGRKYRERRLAAEAAAAAAAGASPVPMR